MTSRSATPTASLRDAAAKGGLGVKGQHAMNLKLQDETAFWAEYQNEPLPEDVPDDDLMSADEIAAKVNP